VPVLLAILGALGAAAFWYYRMRDVGHVANEAVDAAQRLRGTFRRKRFLKKAESSPIAAVEDPAAAAVALMISLASSGDRLSPAAESAIHAEMRDVMALPKADETFIFARWMADHANDSNDLVRRFAKLWLGALQPSERSAFYDMASRIAAVDGDPTAEQIGCLRLLHERLGLTRS
jgi:hypothetical protein